MRHTREQLLKLADLIMKADKPRDDIAGEWVKRQKKDNLKKSRGISERNKKVAGKWSETPNGEEITDLRIISGKLYAFTESAIYEVVVKPKAKSRKERSKKIASLIYIKSKRI